MDKAIIKRIILENQERITKLNLVDREITLTPEANYIITGPRRAGKTFLLYCRIQQMINEGILTDRILYINFEDERLLEFSISDFDVILDSFNELFHPKIPLLFFDEIQNIHGWEKFARRVADTGYQVYITGSNAGMLSNEMASTLGGRFMIREIDTLSFSEFLKFKDLKLQKSFEFSRDRFAIKRAFDEWFQTGGFPEIIKYQDKKEYLNTIFLKVFLGDIVTRYQIRNKFALQLLIKKLAESTMDEISFNRIRHIVQSTGIKVGTATIIDYINYLEEAFLIRDLVNFQHKFTERETKRKYYFRDHGLLNLFLYDSSSSVLETIVFNHLKGVCQNDVNYLKDSAEVDFVIPGKQLIQVCYSIVDSVTREREIRALIKASLTFSIADLLIITYDEEESIIAGDLSIKVKPAWKWMLQNKQTEI